MNLDKLTVEIRPRRPWEAVDLGMLMAQRWWFKLTLIYLLLSLPVWLLLEFIPLSYWYYRLLIFWLLVPLFERPLLYFLSKAVFNEIPTIKDVLKAAPKLMLRQIILSLTWRRFSFSRSMDAPVVILENLKGKQRAQRLQTLHREDSSPAGWLSVVCFVFVYALAMSLLIVTLQFANHFLDTPWWELVEEDGWIGFLTRWMGLLLYYFLYLGFVLVAPFYVATGFALYLNRRIKLEAWDVEIAFRRIVQKRAQQEQRIRTTALPAILLACIIFLPSINPMPALAVSEEAPVADETAVNSEELSEIDRAKKEIETILKSEDFNRIKVERNKRLPFEQKPEEEKDSNTDFMDKLMEFLESLVKGLANWGEILLWIVVLCLVFYLLFRYRHWFAELAPELKLAKKAKPELLFGLDVTEESLPDDVGASALELWRSGKHREALALLYRACLAQLIGRGLELEDGDTELECLQVTEQHAHLLKLQQPTITYFRNLTEHWRKLAYGHIAPAEPEGLQLCGAWSRAWDADYQEQSVLNKDSQSEN